MMKTNENGRSMIEMLGVLAVIGILTLASFAGYQKAITKSRVNKTVQTIVSVIQNYADISLKNLNGVSLQGTDAMQNAAQIGLVEACEMVESQTDEGYNICELPVGELYMKLQDAGNNKYSYMLYITLINEKPEICSMLLAQGWDQIIPKEWQDRSMIWLKSDTSESVVYAENNYTAVNAGTLANICNSTCPEGYDYCTIVFDFGNVY